MEFSSRPTTQFRKFNQTSSVHAAINRKEVKRWQTKALRRQKRMKAARMYTLWCVPYARGASLAGAAAIQGHIQVDTNQICISLACSSSAVWSKDSETRQKAGSLERIKRSPPSPELGTFSLSKLYKFIDGRKRNFKLRYEA